ncbi:hypothetical protein Dda_4618 [Drechslerella dactyloides]|uniref:Protein SQS1 n=1 Tax=Drechslerella dactyloides TaxID=74499 RepID=A0AAD6NJF0_DREDA|nr:hypothetical protein Dda_4618 [Drechslerella dactyloides]
MPRRKQPRPAPSHRANSNHHSNRHQAAMSPHGGRRGKAQRLLLLGDDYDLGLYDRPGPTRGHHNLTLAQEARNTEERAYRGNSDRKLRQMGITFVSPQDPQDPENLIGTLQSSSSSEEEIVDPIQSHADNSLHGPAPASATASDLDNGLTESQPATPRKNPKIETPVTPVQQSINEVSSPVEEVVFVPRNRRRNLAAQPEPQKPSSTTILEQIKVETNVIMERSTAKKDQTIEEPRTFNAGKSASKSPKKNRRGLKQPDYDDMDDEEADIMEDYIRNLQENGETLDSAFSLRLLGNQLPEVDSDEHQIPSNDPQAPDEASSETSEPKSSDEEIEWDVHTAIVIGKRYGETGIEYLFKPAGSALDEAIWLATDMLDEIQHLVDHFEAGLGDVDLPEWSQQQDETLAMLLQQEDDDDEDFEFDVDDMISMMNGGQNKRGVFPNASKLADAYDDFDIMDRNRASLAGPSKRKPRKASLAYQIPAQFLAEEELDDAEEDEIRAQLDKYIAQDRERKRARKQEREDRRAAGLLGKAKAPKTASMDIRSFSDGPLGGQVNALITTFLMNGLTERLTLPPMSKQERAQIHVIASKFFMTSKSQGKGDERFPVLYKTKRTTLFEGDEAAIAGVLSAVGNRFARNGPVRGNFRALRRGGGGGGGGEIRNKDGMIVGTGAAEIGQGNKGYEMLAKMGWTTGTGLGSNRSGILDPVQAIVKNSRTGLG